MSNLFAIKPPDWLIAESRREDTHSLKRALGPVNLMSLGIGAIIGAGIFVLTGTVAAQAAGPAVVLSFVLSGLGCAFAGLCYAEFASMIPIAGSAYSYGYATLGEIFAWIIGWDLILEYAFGSSTVASGWSGNLNLLLQHLGWALPPQLTDAPGALLVQYQGFWQSATNLPPGVSIAGLPAIHAVFNLVAFLVIMGITLVLVVGIKESANINSVIVVVKLATVMIFIGVAAIYVFQHPSVALSNWHPFIPPNQGTFGQFGWSGIARGASLVFFAYIGFDAVSTTAQEARKPQRDMPLGILGSLAICTVLYIITAGLLTGVVNYTRLQVAAPVAVGIEATGVRWGTYVVLIGTILGLTSTMMVMLLGQSRILFAMSRDGLLPRWAGAIHPRFRTPWIATLVVGTFVALFGSLFSLVWLVELCSIGTLLAFVIVCCGVLVLRRKRPDLPRPFRTPFVPLVPVLGIIICLLMMYSLPFGAKVRLVVWLLIGFAIYFGYGRKHSLVQKGLKPEAVSSDEPTMVGR
ncbi:MAG TPA: amino acid permease [Candidatus Angelobacter sp.]|nr:amino acid permease [Candidatus Angelobacter sp.]